jgi:periplasmic protein TonB
VFAHVSGQPAQRLSPAGLATVIALHAVVFYALLQMNVIKLPVELPLLQVELLTPPAPELPKPEIVPPKPRPVEKRPVPRPVQDVTPLAIPAEAPVAAPTVEVPAVPPAPTFAPPAPPAPAAPSKPRFDADYLDNPKPAYPYGSRRLKEEGRVVLRVQVAANGLPSDVTVHTGSGHERLDQAALETVRRWKFVPARLGNEPVAASVLVPIVFSLKD